MHLQEEDGNPFDRRRGPGVRLQAIYPKGMYCLIRVHKQAKRYKECQSNITHNDNAKLQSSHGMIQGYNAALLADDFSEVLF